jgi:hypothetical protein
LVDFSTEMVVLWTLMFPCSSVTLWVCLTGVGRWLCCPPAASCTCIPFEASQKPIVHRTHECLLSLWKLSKIEDVRCPAGPSGGFQGREAFTHFKTNAASFSCLFPVQQVPKVTDCFENRSDIVQDSISKTRLHSVVIVGAVKFFLTGNSRILVLHKSIYGWMYSRRDFLWLGDCWMLNDWITKEGLYQN